jgi:glycosyltransferase involved in cell wall biosynthesis
MPRKSVCLNMIVKDEAHVIRRCLGSVRPLIDSWVIVDTGSSDGTQSLKIGRASCRERVS